MKTKYYKQAINKFLKLSKALLVIILFTQLANGQVSVNTKLTNSKIIDSTAKNNLSIVKVNKINPIDTIVKNSNSKKDKKNDLDSLFVTNGKLRPFKNHAIASYYADKFHGRKTASGKLYDKNKLTAAHKKLPFGTIVKVTNEANGKSIIVEITDRGPFIKSREIDLSKRAFIEISGNKFRGLIYVTLEIVKK